MLIPTVATLTLLASSSVAFAATSSSTHTQSKSTATTKALESYKTAPTVISYNGVTVSKSVHIVAVDPSSKKSTSWVPIYYVNQVLEKAGVHASWNATLHEWDITLPKTWKPNVSQLPKSQSTDSARIAIRFTNTNTIVEYAPRIVAPDAYSHVSTTYVPVYYVEQVLKRMGFQTSWNGTDWVIKH
ncbi:hypothetical protein GCM10025857_31550 [Alicyclobacillus contaminans]|nr:hypothetical protein GCM10025857_31550 [Alicyclobacillus contaminans]